METFLLIGLICICILLVGYLGILFLLYWRKNPKQTSIEMSTYPPSNLTQRYHERSIVTHTSIGRRGDMGNQIFQLACIIAAGRRSHADIVIPTHIGTLPISQLFDLSSFIWKDVVPDSVYYEYDNYRYPI